MITANQGKHPTLAFTVPVTGGADARPLCDSGLVTEPEPTPVFRRFPWTQLVFCLACLSMTAWTWMRYSYAWDVTPPDLYDVRQAPMHIYVHQPWRDAYVTVWPTDGSHFVSEDPVEMRSGRWTDADAYVSTRQGDIALVGHPLFVRRRSETDHSVPAREQYAGRIAAVNTGFGRHVVLVEATASRFHPASIAGLVVGAMGVFIFSLYLRGWLRERKALASQPGRDMMA